MKRPIRTNKKSATYVEIIIKLSFIYLRIKKKKNLNFVDLITFFLDMKIYGKKIVKMNLRIQIKFIPLNFFSTFRYYGEHNKSFYGVF